MQAHLKATQADVQPKLLKELAKPTQKKRNFKNAPPHDRKTIKEKPTNRPPNYDRQGSTGGNSVYVAKAGEVVNRRSLLLRNFVLNGKESASNTLLNIHAKRYVI